jgi:hypothetical protein
VYAFLAANNNNKMSEVTGTVNGFDHLSSVALAKPIYCALAFKGVNATQADVKKLATGTFLKESKPLYEEYCSYCSGLSEETDTMLSHSDFASSLVDVFNTKLTVDGIWAQFKKTTRKIGDMFHKPLLALLKFLQAQQKANDTKVWLPEGAQGLTPRDKTLAKDLSNAIRACKQHALLQHFNVTNHKQKDGVDSTSHSVQVSSQLNAFHSGDCMNQDTTEGFAVPGENMLQGTFLCELFRTSIQYALVGMVKTWEEGEYNLMN